MEERTTRTFFRVLAVLTFLALVLYFGTRTFFFFTASVGLFDYLFAGLLLLAEGYAVTHALGYLLGVYRVEQTRFTFERVPLTEDALPHVAVIVPVYNEPLSVVSRTLLTVAALEYPHKNVYLLDGSTDRALVDGARELCERYGIHHYRPAHVHHSKAGTVNEFLTTMSEEYVAIFDADQSPMPHFLRDIVPIIVADPKLAFVQTPQLYENIIASRIAKGAAMQQSIFYEIVCEAKHTIGAAFCCGTNVLLRAQALRSVGGFDETSVTEDFSTSFRLHCAGWKSAYYNHVLAFGMAPESLRAYFIQQARWAIGSVALLRPLVRAFLTRPSALRPTVWFEYFLSASYFFIGWSFFFMALGPALFLLSGVPTYFKDPLVYFGTYLPFALLNSALFFGTIRRRHYTFGNLFYGLILGSLSFPVLMRAAVRGLLGRRAVFAVTPKEAGDALPLTALLPWIGLILLNLTAAVLGFTRLADMPLAIAINVFWCLYHVALLSQIFVLNHAPRVVAPQHSAVQ